MTDLQQTKSYILDLVGKINYEEQDRQVEICELRIAHLIIEYSLRNKISIPLINHLLYEQENNSEEYDYFKLFIEAIGDGMIASPRFKSHPEIKELVSC